MVKAEKTESGYFEDSSKVHSSVSVRQIPERNQPQVYEDKAYRKMRSTNGDRRGAKTDIDWCNSSYPSSPCRGPSKGLTKRYTDKTTCAIMKAYFPKLNISYYAPSCHATLCNFGHKVRLHKKRVTTTPEQVYLSLLSAGTPYIQNNKTWLSSLPCRATYTLST